MNKAEETNGDDKPAGAPEFTLFLFPNGCATISCTLGNVSQGIRIDLPARAVRMIFLLRKAYETDRNLPSAIRGCRSCQTLSKECGRDPNNTSLEPETIGKYLRILSRYLDRTPDGCAPFPPLIDRMPRAGTRLLHPITVVQVGGETSDG